MAPRDTGLSAGVEGRQDRRPTAEKGDTSAKVVGRLVENGDVLAERVPPSDGTAYASALLMEKDPLTGPVALVLADKQDGHAEGEEDQKGREGRLDRGDGVPRRRPRVQAPPPAAAHRHGRGDAVSGLETPRPTPGDAEKPDPRHVVEEVGEVATRPGEGDLRDP